MNSPEKTIKLFRKGCSLKEIAFKRNLAFSTIENHLRILLEKKKIAINELMPIERVELIEKAIPENPVGLSAIKDSLPEEVSYGEIKWVLTAIGKFKGKKRKSPMVKAINTYAGNYCVRKCFNHLEIIQDCRRKFDELAETFGEKEISISEFFRLMNSGAIKICKLPEEKRRRVIVWKQFERLQDKNTDFWDLP